jgi:hypothetical protein
MSQQYFICPRCAAIHDVDPKPPAGTTPYRSPCLCTDLRTDGHGNIRQPHPACPIHTAPASAEEPV